MVKVRRNGRRYVVCAAGAAEQLRVGGGPGPAQVLAQQRVQDWRDRTILIAPGRQRLRPRDSQGVPALVQADPVQGQARVRISFPGPPHRSRFDEGVPLAGMPKCDNPCGASHPFSAT